MTATAGYLFEGADWEFEKLQRIHDACEPHSHAKISAFFKPKNPRYALSFSACDPQAVIEAIICLLSGPCGGIDVPGAARMNAAPGQGSSSSFGRNCVHGSAPTFAREHEALVALLGDLGALPAIPADAFRAEVRQEAARLAGDIGAHVPGIGARQQRPVHDFGDMRAPRVLRLRGRLDRRKLISAHVGDAFGDPLDVLLDRHRHVRQHRGALRAGDREQVRVASYGQPEISLRALLPFLRLMSLVTDMAAAEGYVARLSIQ